MILTNYIDLKHIWEKTACLENSQLRKLVKNNDTKNLVPLNMYRKDTVNFYNYMTDISIGNIKNEIKKYKEKINKIEKSKNKKELQEIIGVSFFHMDSADFDTIKNFLIYMYLTKIKYYEQVYYANTQNRRKM